MPRSLHVAGAERWAVEPRECLGREEGVSGGGGGAGGRWERTKGGERTAEGHRGKRRKKKGAKVGGRVGERSV